MPARIRLHADTVMLVPRSVSPFAVDLPDDVIGGLDTPGQRRRDRRGTASTAFTSRLKADRTSSQLILRRVKRLNPTSATAENSTADNGASERDKQGELFAVYRIRSVFSDSPLTLVQTKTSHRGHAVIE